MSRTPITLVVALLVISAGAVAPVSAQLLESNSAENPPIVTVGAEGHPSYILSLDNDSADALEDWAAASDSRTLVRLDNDTNTATVAAPSWELTGGLSAKLSAMTATPSDALSILQSSALAERSYVQDISPNWQLSRAKPVTLDNESAIDGPPQIGALAFNDPEYSTNGVAYSGDANKTTPAEFRAALGVDNVSANASDIVIAPIDTGTNTADGLVFGNGTEGSDIRIHNASANMITGESVNASAGNFDAIADGNGHGTWVSSIAAADYNNSTYDGMAPNATLLVLKALSDDGSGSTSDIAAAIRRAAGDNPDNATADVITMSLGSPVYSPALADAVAYAYDQGVDAVFIAVGNSRQRGPMRWVASPADVNSTVAVAASTGEEPNAAESAYFSNVGPDPSTTDGEGAQSAGAMPDVVAPGMRTTAMTPDTSGFVSEHELSGTSMATPGAAGAFALALAANSSLADLDHEQIHDQIRESARPTPNIGVTEGGAGMFSADTLASGDYPEQDHAETLTSGAESRDVYNRGLSDASGGAFTALAATARIGV